MKWKLKSKIINQSKCLLFESINRIEKSLTTLTKSRRKTQINKSRNEKGDTTLNISDIQVLI
jgi:hypothetical protein